MNATVLTMTNEMNRQEWLEARKKGIGGSDAAAIAGLNKWKSPVAVFLDKTGQTPEQEIDSEAAHFGNVLEDVVAKEFSERTGLKVRRRNAILQHPEHPYMLANVDRLIVGEKVGLECKTASEYLKDEWKDDEIPAQYLIQCQHYMAVTGYQAWWIAVLIGGNKFVYKKVERDEDIINYLVDIQKNFWNNHVLQNIPPAFDGSDASTTLLKELYPISVEDSEVELPLDADALLFQFELAKKEEKDVKARKAEAENKLKAMLGENERGRAGDRWVTWKTYKSNRFDSKRFQKDHPELYQQYLNESTARKFSVK